MNCDSFQCSLPGQNRLPLRFKRLCSMKAKVGVSTGTHAVKVCQFYPKKRYHQENKFADAQAESRSQALPAFLLKQCGMRLPERLLQRSDPRRKRLKRLFCALSKDALNTLQMNLRKPLQFFYRYKTHSAMLSAESTLLPSLPQVCDAEYRSRQPGSSSDSFLSRLTARR